MSTPIESNIFLEIKKISKKYNNKEILKNISFNIFSGEIFSLLGINGAGKSTLTNIIGTIKKPSDGDIIYKKQSIYKNLNEFKKIIGYTPQIPNLNSTLTMYQNLLFAGKCFGLTDTESKQNIYFLVEKLNLKEYLDQYDYTLSGGWKQRFMIARSLINLPKFIILDEPTTGLDANIRKELWNLLHELKKDGMTILLTTHYLEEAEVLSDRVCILHEGEIKLIDTTKSLLEKFNQNTLEKVFLESLKGEQK